MNCIVTGGAGFIGSHIVERLVHDGHRVTVLDNFCTGRKENLQGIKDAKRLSLVEIDLADRSARLDKYFRAVDWVFHLAARADIVPSIVDPLAYHDANVTGTIQVLRASMMARVKRFIYTASASCYGIPKKIPTSETAPIQPQYPYAMTKYIGELYALHFARVYKLPVVSLRLFNVYGPRSRTSGTYGAVFGTFLAQKLAGKPFTVVGDGKQKRDFTFVSDVVEAFIRAASSDVVGEVFNVGSGQSHSVNTLVKLLGGKAIQIPKRPGEPDDTCADIAKIRRVLGWAPKVRFSDGVSTLLDHIDYWKHAPVWTAAKIERATKDWFIYLAHQ